MSTTEFNFFEGQGRVRIADFIAFVNDKKTEQVLKSFVLEQAMPHTYIAIGGVNDAIAYLAKLDRSPLFLLVDLHDSVMPLSDLGRSGGSVRAVGAGGGARRTQRRRPVPQPAEDRRARLSREAADGGTDSSGRQCPRAR
jgi:hypothetical protein